MKSIKGYLEQKDGQIMGIASTEGTDRDGEIIKQDGWDLSNFGKNPVLMLMHNYQEFPVGKVVDIGVKDGKLTFTAMFSGATQKAKECYALVKEGILNCFSVGFIPREFDPKDQSIITKSELLEISLVPIPANPEAVVLAKTFKGNDIATYIVKNFLQEEDKKEENEEDVDTKKDSKLNLDSTTKVQQDKVREESAKALDIDLKVIQRTTGMLQELCRELKKKGGANLK